MTPIPKVPSTDTSHEQRGGGGAGEFAVAATTPRTLDPALAERFLALIEEVTDTLLQHRQGVERSVCRADAIALLMATAQQMDPADAAESPLHYLLLEERHKAVAALQDSEGASALPRFVRA
jgi:hypothetical protein